MLDPFIPNMSTSDSSLNSEGESDIRPKNIHLSVSTSAFSPDITRSSGKVGSFELESFVQMSIIGSVHALCCDTSFRD